LDRWSDQQLTAPELRAAWSIEMTQTHSANQAFILQAMLSIAAADGNLHDDELATIRTIYEQVSGEALSTDDINTASSLNRSSGLSFADRLAITRDQLTRELKETILGSAYMVLLADGRVSARERKKLMDLVNALKISEVHRSIIFEDVERTLH
jgi:tellurite resistance protein